MKNCTSRMVVTMLSVVLVFCAAAAYAEEQYQTEVSANYVRTDENRDTRVLMYGVSAEVFFAPVKTAEHPYAEAAFLEHIGSVFVSVVNEEMTGTGLEGNGPSLAASINYTRPDFPLVIIARYATLKFDFDKPANTKLKGTFYGLRVGNYFTHTLLAGVEYSYSKSDSSNPLTTLTINSKDYGLFAKYVHELEHGRELSFEGSLGTSKSDDGTKTLSNTNVALSVDYFFNRSVSAGVGIENSSGDDKDFEGRTYSANVRYFITPRFSVEADYDRFLNANAGQDDEKTIGATLAVRF